MGGDRYLAQKQLNEAGRWAHSGEYAPASGAGSVKSEHKSGGFAAAPGGFVGDTTNKRVGHLSNASEEGRLRTI